MPHPIKSTGEIEAAQQATSAIAVCISDGLDALFKITCGKCGQTNQITDWMQDIWGRLPFGHYQCPDCGHAFERKPNPNYKNSWDKAVVCEEIQSTLKTSNDPRSGTPDVRREPR